MKQPSIQDSKAGIEPARLLVKKDVIIQGIRQVAQLGFEPRPATFRESCATVTLSSSITGPLYASPLVRERQILCVLIHVSQRGN